MPGKRRQNWRHYESWKFTDSIGSDILGSILNRELKIQFKFNNLTAHFDNHDDEQ